VPGEREAKSVPELAAMSEDERVEYFLANPMDGQDPAIDPVFVARSRARLIPIVERRDAEQAARRRTPRAS
jgi:hypothetical protein